MTEANVVALDLASFHRRAAEIVRVREQARREAEECGIEEAEAEYEYLKRRAIRLAYHRSEGAAWSAAEKLAEGDEVVAEWRLKRDMAKVLRRSAESRWSECEASRAMLNKEASMAQDAGLAA